MTDFTCLPLLARAEAHADREAIRLAQEEFTYRQLLAASTRVAAGLLSDASDLGEARVAFLTLPGFDYAAVQWGIWRAGGVAVPLCPLHPRPELGYVLDHSDASIVVAQPRFAEMLRPMAEQVGRRFALTTELLEAQPVRMPGIELRRRAMILYTSGTTSKPKGVVTRHENIQAQVTTLIDAWEWQSDDRILLVLPLHHVHGIINVLTCALWAGATCDVLPNFDADEVWERFVAGGQTLFMAVPTMYRKLIAVWEAAPPARQRTMSEACRRMRLMVCGSAALPVSVLEQWRQISGHVLLERYGMTEIGMAISNPLHGLRLPGRVGRPLPGVDVRLVEEAGGPTEDGQPGEIQVRGPSVFCEYWRDPQATASAFRDGWFCTGDIAVREEGVYRILGRSSVDIIKTGGYKVSALEVEEVLRSHPAVQECAVVGVDDPEWGERVSAAIVLKAGAELSLISLRSWAKERLAGYKAPAAVLVVSDLPRNTMGKVTKTAVRQLFLASES
jgi:malonyl-CoA/methylmalonyl-CoA synthetase